jgi:fibronectin-binding autotransporter adhesin
MRGINVGLALILVLATAAPVFAQTIWTDGAGDWFNATNSSAGVPNSSTAGQINNGGTAQITLGGATGAVTLGSGAQDSGTLSVSGAGRLDGNTNVGVSGTGTLSITNGGHVFNSSNTAIAANSGSTGLVTVDGGGSVWTLASSLAVAVTGAGTLTVTGGGTVSTSGSSGTTIGRDPGSNGVATISGAGSAWTISSSLSIGNGFGGTFGALHIAAGGTVSNTAGFLGGGFTGNGTATVDGSGSTWMNSGDLSIGGNATGAAGTGVLTITQGGIVSSSSGSLGFGTGANGTAEVDGAGSTWTNSGNLYVGGGPNGPERAQRPWATADQEWRNGQRDRNDGLDFWHAGDRAQSNSQQRSYFQWRHAPSDCKHYPFTQRVSRVWRGNSKFERF